MLTTIILALTLAADPATTALEHARANVATAEHVTATCWTPAACDVARQLADAAQVELAAATALATPTPPAPPASVDPWQSDVYVEPFAADEVPEAVEAQAAYQLASVQTGFDDLGK